MDPNDLSPAHYTIIGPTPTSPHPTLAFWTPPLLTISSAGSGRHRRRSLPHRLDYPRREKRRPLASRNPRCLPPQHSTLSTSSKPSAPSNASMMKTSVSRM
ncbi:hypothetical protein DsansV1_C13g0125771 [Dioscorea sansibarensis]